MGKLNRREPEGKKTLKLISGKTISKLNKENNEISDKIIKLRKQINKETDKNNNEKQENNDEYLKEIKWREEQVARVFREQTLKRGRPTKVNEQLIVNMEVLARIGLSEEAICNAVCVAHTTLIQWKKKNKELSKRLKEAREHGKSVLINSIFGHGVKNWQASAWLLERMHRQEFGQNQKVELTGKDSGPLIFKVVYSDKAESTSKKEQS